MIWLCLGEYRGPESIRAFIRYYVQWRKQKDRETVYRNYVTDALRLITENTAKLGGGQYLITRFADIGKKRPKPEQSGKEIASGIIAGLTQ